MDSSVRERTVVGASELVATRRWWQALRTLRPSRGFVTLLALFVLTFLLAWGYRAGARSYTLTINRDTFTVRTHQRTVGGVLRERGIALRPQDIVYPSPSTPLSPRTSVLLQLAREITLSADGDRTVRYTHAESVGDVLREAGITLGPDDAVLLNGRHVTVDVPLPRLAGNFGRPEGTVRVQRAMPITIDDDGAALTVHTRADTLGKALLAEGIQLYEGDDVRPDLATRITPDLHVRIRRSKPVILTFDGTTIRTRTRAKTVESALAEQGVALRPLDRVTPARDAPVTDNVDAVVTRVDHEVIVESEPIPFERQLVPDPELELDTFAIQQHGEQGEFRRRILVVYENGEETERQLQEEWVEREPVDKVVAYGTNVVVRTLETPQGPVEYWRHIPMLATSYTAATSGKQRSNPRYGITRTGVEAGYGKVAVDPRLVRLNSQVYVPGYGTACACDTGGAILGRRIDLGYNEGELRFWYRWVDVYVLAPPPPSGQIRYILPGADVP